MQLVELLEPRLFRPQKVRTVGEKCSAVQPIQPVQPGASPERSRGDADQCRAAEPKRPSAKARPMTSLCPLPDHAPPLPREFRKRESSTPAVQDGAGLTTMPGWFCRSLGLRLDLSDFVRKGERDISCRPSLAQVPDFGFVEVSSKSKTNRKPSAQRPTGPKPPKSES